MLVDSSIWISAQSPTKAETLQLRRLILKNERLCICDVIVTEVCQGARTEVEFQNLQNAFLGFEWLDHDRLVWKESSWNFFRARKAGLTVGTVDCFLATLAKKHRVPLWSVDKIFPKLQRIIGFDLYEP